MWRNTRFHPFIHIVVSPLQWKKQSCSLPASSCILSPCRLCLYSSREPKQNAQARQTGIHTWSGRKCDARSSVKAVVETSVGKALLLVTLYQRRPEENRGQHTKMFCVFSDLDKNTADRSHSSLQGWQTSRTKMNRWVSLFFKRC